MKKLILVFALLFVGCGGKPTAPELYQGMAAARTTNPHVPVIAVHQDGSFVSVVSDIGGNMKGAVYTSESNENFTVWLGDNGLPARAVIGNYVILFDKYAGSKVDVAVISPNGNIQIYRDVAVNADEIQAIRYASKIAVQQSSDFWKYLRIGLLALSIAACIIAIVKSAGALLPAIKVPCGKAILSLGLTITAALNPKLEDTSRFIGVAVSTFLCSRGDNLSCVSLITSAGEAAENRAAETAGKVKDEIAVAKGALIGGSGDVQVTLTWDNASDIDLWVTDPAGEKIYWEHPTSKSGGWLDFDDRDGFGPENVFWPKGKAPRGTYKVQVNYFEGTGTANFRVLVQAFSQVKAYSGRLTAEGMNVEIVTFTDSSRLPKVAIPQTSFEHSLRKKP